MSYPSSYANNKEHIKTYNVLKITIYKNTCKDCYLDTHKDKDRYKNDKNKDINTSCPPFFLTKDKDKYFKVIEPKDNVMFLTEEQYLQNLSFSIDSIDDTRYYNSDQIDKIPKLDKKKIMIKFETIFNKIIENSKNLLLEYDMLDEFKNYYNYNSIFNNFNKINYNSEEEAAHRIIKTFVNDVISCCLSYESIIKSDLNDTDDIEDYNLNQEYKEKLYKIEYKCMILFNKIEENKFKSEELYLEYSKILDLKKIYEIPENILFLKYFTPEKIKDLENLLFFTNFQTSI